MKEIYIKADNEKLYNKIVVSAMISDWMFNFPVPKDLLQTCTFSRIKKNYYGNSKILLRLFYNDITGKYEMQATTKTVSLSYPQNKTIKVYDFENVNYKTMVDIFGEA